MAAKSKQKQHIPLRIRLVFLSRNWIWLFWLVLLPIVWIMLPLERLANPIAGYVAAETENIGALETVRIRALHVAAGQKIDLNISTMAVYTGQVWFYKPKKVPI